MEGVASLKGKPGTAGLGELWSKLEKADPGAINEFAGKLDEAAGEAQAHGKAARNAVSGLDGAWDGKAADAFVGYMEKFDQAGVDLQSSMTDAASALRTIAEELKSARSAVNSICAEAARRIEKLEGGSSGDGATSGNADGRNRERMAEIGRAAVEDVGKKIDAAESALSEAKGKLDGAKEPASRFSRLAAPGEIGFVPEGRKVQGWQPVPPGSDGTNPADAGPQGQPMAVSGSGGGSGGLGGSGGGSSGAGSPGGGFGGGGAGGSGGGAGGGGGFGGYGASGPPPTTQPPGNVEEWIREAIRILQENGLPVTEENIDEIWTIIEHESGGDPNAINNWDSNAAKGTPSKGLMQCIDPTFDAHKLPGHGDIYDPVDNIIAGVRYTFDRYGGFEGHPGLQSMASGGGYQGY